MTARICSKWSATRRACFSFPLLTTVKCGVRTSIQVSGLSPPVAMRQPRSDIKARNRKQPRLNGVQAISRTQRPGSAEPQSTSGPIGLVLSSWRSASTLHRFVSPVARFVQRLPHEPAVESRSFPRPVFALLGRDLRGSHRRPEALLDFRLHGGALHRCIFLDGAGLLEIPSRTAPRGTLGWGADRLLHVQRLRVPDARPVAHHSFQVRVHHRIERSSCSRADGRVLEAPRESVGLVRRAGSRCGTLLHHRSVERTRGPQCGRSAHAGSCGALCRAYYSGRSLLAPSLRRSAQLSPGCYNRAAERAGSSDSGVYRMASSAVRRKRGIILRYRHYLGACNG